MKKLNVLRNLLDVFILLSAGALIKLFQICLKKSLREYSLIIHKHNQKLISILENQKIYGGFLKILIFCVSLSRTHLQIKTFLFKAKS